MKCSILIIIYLFCVASADVKIGNFTYTNEEVKNMESALDHYRDLARRADTMPREEAIPQLGKALFKTSQPSIFVVGDRLGVRQELQKVLLSIPGHAEYYAEIIKSETDDRERMWHFETLGQMPSPETVRVLGEMLSDTERYLSPEDRTFDTQLVKSNAEYAVQYLEQFKLAKIPRERPLGSVVKEDIARWKEWYDQVKAGRATFRFEGDPREYHLHGPVDGARLASSQRPAKREEPHEAPEEEDEAVSTPAVTVMTVMAVLMCLWALWQCWKMRPGRGAA